LFRYQGFTTLAAEFWDIRHYFDKTRQVDPFSNEMIKLVGEKMEFKITQTDGSFFSTFVLALENVLKICLLLPSELKIFIEMIVNDEDSIGKLKKYIFDEFEGYRKNLYTKSFIDENRSYQDSDFLSKLVVAAANLFNFPIIIVPAAYGLPMLPVFPLDHIINHPIFIIFDPFINSFKAYLRFTGSSDNETIICYCGQRKQQKSSKLSCFQNFSCKCLKNKVSCSSLCKCKGCCNNKTTIKSEPINKRRKRIPHLLSRVENVSSLQYLMNCEIPKADSLSINSFQHFFLEALLYFLMKDMKLYSLLEIEISLLASKMYQKYVALCDDSKLIAGYVFELFRSTVLIAKVSMDKWLFIDGDK